MKIELNKISVKDIAKDYVDSAEEGVVGFSGKLDIRPAFQREFVYKDKQRDAVIETIRKKFPLNVMYWVKNGGGKNENFEVLDGQQRTISICQYIKGDFSIKFDGKNPQYFHTLTKPEQEQILNYELMIYFCEGNEKEKTDWFQTINIAGMKLTDQELRNAIYRGPWVSDAKLKFSKTGCAAYGLAKDYVSGSPIRQEFLETAIDWISGGEVAKYMSEHQHDENANKLWEYFEKVIDWVKNTFTTYRKEMKGVNWGKFYNELKDTKLNAKKLETEIAKLMQDEEVTNPKGIYEYVLNGNERALNIRAFTDKQKRETYEKQKGICPKCKKHFEIKEMEADHRDLWSEGGKTITENCQMLCKADHREKSGK
jgi:hypothetical protein